MFQLPRVGARPRRFALIIVTALVGVATAALVSVAVAKTFTLEIAKGVKVSNITNPSAMTKVENVAANSHGRAVYTLSGDGKRHPKCTKSNGCFGFWPPVTVASGKKPSKAPAIKGRLGVWHRGRINQVTLNGHPLYTFSVDKAKGSAHGDGIATFGGVWHVIKTSRGVSSSGTSSTGTTPTTNPYGY